MKQLAIISGKGGTGKTTLTASLAALADQVVIADCDVEAADLPLLLGPEQIVKHPFSGGITPVIDYATCTRCGVCVGMCRYGAISPDIRIDQSICENCGVCVDHCPEKAILETEDDTGFWFESKSEFGPLLYAELRAGKETSGKLVSEVRRRAAEICERDGRELVIIDGPPGIGCPVISAVTGVDLALIITEPSPSGLHDMDRALELMRHFDLPTRVVLNKADLAPEFAKKVFEYAVSHNVEIIGSLPYDAAAIEAIAAGRPVVRNGESPLATAIENLWRETSKILASLT